MKCPKCNRNTPDNKKTCMYCGESWDGRILSENNLAETEDNKTFVQKDEIEKPEITALPDTVELHVKDISHKEPTEISTHKETTITIDSLDDVGFENRTEMSLEKALNLLTGMKDSFKRGHINTADYEKLVFEIIKDYIMPMGDKEKINFVANGIMDTELYGYLDEEIHKELRSFVITHVSNNK